MKRAPTPPGPFRKTARSLAGIAELGRHVRERVLELAAERVDDRDDGDRDAGGDQAILDGGRTGLVLRELHKGLHLATPGSTWLSELVPRPFVSRPIRILLDALAAPRKTSGPSAVRVRPRLLVACGDFQFIHHFSVNSISPQSVSRTGLHFAGI